MSEEVWWHNRQHARFKIALEIFQLGESQRVMSAETETGANHGTAPHSFALAFALSSDHGVRSSVRLRSLALLHYHYSVLKIQSCDCWPILSVVCISCELPMVSLCFY